MREELLKFFATREERVPMAGKTFLVRTLDDGEAIEGEDAFYQLVVRCTFDAEGARVFEDSDIETLKTTRRIIRAPLFAAVRRVNGLDAAEEEKNSDAGPSSG